MSNAKRLHVTIVAALCALSVTLFARTDMTASMVDMWELAEASGSATGAHAGIVLAETAASVGTGTLGGRAARDFEYSDNKWLSTTNTAMNLTAHEAFTVAARFNMESQPAFENVGMLGRNDYNQDRVWHLQWRDTQGLRFYVNSAYSTGAFVESSIALAVATTYTVIAWHDPVADLIYISVNNETPISTAWANGVNTVSVATVPFTIGAGDITDARKWDGLIGSVGFWKRVLTAGERTEFYNSGNGVAYAAISGGGGGTAPCRMLLLGACDDLAPWLTFAGGRK